MTRGGRKDSGEDGPERRCIVTGETKPRSGLVRFVADGEGRILPDIAEKLPGRGVWVSCNRPALEKAMQKGLFSRSLKHAVKADPNLPTLVEDLVVRRLVELLSLARKAGLAVAGFEKVKARIGMGEVRLLFQAHDGSEDGRRKLRAPIPQEARIEVLSAAELGLAFGRTHVIHAALSRGGISDRIEAEALRLAGIRLGRGARPDRMLDDEDGGADREDPSLGNMEVPANGQDKAGMADM